LSDYNVKWTKHIANEILGIEIKFMDSRDIAHEGVGADRVLSICESLSASSYLSGPSGANYLDAGSFRSKGIDLRFANYSRLPHYNQLHGEFAPKVSIIDMIMNVKSGYSELIEISDIV
jgi:hypothetical protein